MISACTSHPAGGEDAGTLEIPWRNALRQTFTLSALGVSLLAILFLPAAAQQIPSILAPQPQQPSIETARTLMRADRFGEAAALLQELAQTQPTCADCLYLLAYALLRQNQPAASLQTFTQAAALRTPSAVDLRNVAQDYALLDDYADADKWIRRSVAMNPNDPDTLYSLGRIQYTEQFFAEAVKSFQRVLAVAPVNVKAEDNLGLSYEGLNDLEDAKAAYRRAIAAQQTLPLAQRSEQPLLNLAIVLLHEGKLMEAESLLKEAVLIAPKNGPVHEQLGHLYMQSENFASAEGEFELAVAATPKSSSLHFLLGQAYRRLGKQDEAKREFALAAGLTGASRGGKPQ